jgi:hypothetical protein
MRAAFIRLILKDMLTFLFWVAQAQTGAVSTFAPSGRFWF